MLVNTANMQKPKYFVLIISLLFILAGCGFEDAVGNNKITDDQITKARENNSQNRYLNNAIHDFDGGLDDELDKDSADPLKEKAR